LLKGGAKLVALSNMTASSASAQARGLDGRPDVRNVDDIMFDPNIDAVVIATRHDSHSALVQAAVRNKKAVFVEKPLAINSEDIELLRGLDVSHTPVHVNFNRRYSHFSLRALDVLKSCSNPNERHVYYEVNSPLLPLEHWTMHPQIGGGPLIGEGCHFVDLCNLFFEEVPMAISGGYINSGAPERTPSDYVINLLYPSGGTSTIRAIGSSSALPKELIRVRTNAIAIVLEDFRKLTVIEKTPKVVLKGRQDKGIAASVNCFLEKLSHKGQWQSDFNYYLSLSEALIGLCSDRRE